MPQPNELDPQDLLRFIRLKTSRSGGSGGQHVNKVESKVTLSFDLAAADMFSEAEKARISNRLRNRLQADGAVQISSEETRSQRENREIALQKLTGLLETARRPVKPRKATKPTKAAVAARLDAKRKQALRKINRRKDWE